MPTDTLEARKLLRLSVLPPSSLPPHPSLAPAQDGSSTPLIEFVTQLLHEGAKFIDETLPQQFRRVKIQHSPRSKGGDVEVLAGGEGIDDPAANNGRGEYWFARRSLHTLLAEGTAVSERGKATWEEFDEALFKDHSVKEGEYTPDIYDAHKVLDWNEELKDKEIAGWSSIGLEVYEMAHAIQFPMDPRVFATLVLTARDSPTSFITVQVPIDLSHVPSAKYSNGSNRTAGTSSQEKKKPVIGRYVSVERCRKVEADSGAGAVQWDMATASDAAGHLPMVMQKMAITGVIAKDVEFVMDWVAARRTRSESKVTSGSAAS